jgi:hypothetical protein
MEVSAGQTGRARLQATVHDQAQLALYHLHTLPAVPSTVAYGMPC